MPDNQRNLKAKVLQYLDQHRGERIYLQKMVEELNEEPRRIQQALVNIKMQHNYPIESIVKGHSWQVGANTKLIGESEPKKTYTEHAVLRSGALLLERGDGKLFKAILTEVD